MSVESGAHDALIVAHSATGKRGRRGRRPLRMDRSTAPPGETIIIIPVQQDGGSLMTDEEKIDAAAEEILIRFLPALEELAK